MLTEYVEGQSYRFAANPNYFRGAPAVDELVVIVFADDAGAQAAIRTGEVDVIFERIPPEQIDLLDAQDPLDVVLGPEFTTQMINYDASKRPFDDVAVRQAINLAMDRQDIVDTVFLGAATVGSAGWIHPGHSVYNPDIVTVYDPAAANALLDGAGYADTDGDGVREFDGQPMSFEIITNSPDSLRLRIAELTVEMLGRHRDRDRGGAGGHRSVGKCRVARLRRQQRPQLRHRHVGMVGARAGRSAAASLVGPRVAG